MKELEMQPEVGSFSVQGALAPHPLPDQEEGKLGKQNRRLLMVLVVVMIGLFLGALSLMLLR